VENPGDPPGENHRVGEETSYFAQPRCWLKSLGFTTSSCGAARGRASLPLEVTAGRDARMCFRGNMKAGNTTTRCFALSNDVKKPFQRRKVRDGWNGPSNEKESRSILSQIRATRFSPSDQGSRRGIGVFNGELNWL
jgi:hypothetical protein